MELLNDVIIRNLRVFSYKKCSRGRGGCGIIEKMKFAGVTMEKHIEMLGKINSKEDFIKFMEIYVSTINDSSVKEYMESVLSWAEDMEGYYHNNKKEIPQNINWNFIATLLYVGSIYE